MAVTVTEQVRAVGREYQGLPEGIQPWEAILTATGTNTGGQMSLNFEFNPDSLVTFLPYVSLCSVSLRAAVADPGNMDVTLQALHWEKAPFQAVVVKVLVPVVTEAAETRSAEQDDGIYLGRALRGVTANLRVRGLNVDTATYVVACSGLISDRPFMHNKLWSV